RSPSFVSFFFLLLFPPPPCSTLFPYTTLFRSPHQRWWGRFLFGSLRCTSQHCKQLLALLFTKGRSGCDDLSDDGIVAKGAVDEVDRKSTRLNSSHVSISYAVFCLKKKKHTYKG